MRRLVDLWKSDTTLRGLAALFSVATAGFFVCTFVLVPAFRDKVGFTPFDLQSRLNREALVIQLAAAGRTDVLFDYTTYALADSIVGMTAAWFFIVFWIWVFRKVPTGLFAFLLRGGIVVLPAVVAILAIAEHMMVYRVVTTRIRDAGDAIDLVISLHRTRLALIDLRDGLTLVIVAVALWILGSRLRSSRRT